MYNKKYKRIPNHIGIIPDGNRRWATSKNLGKQEGYAFGVEPGIKLYEMLLKFGVKEATFYGFTKDNTKRPSVQTEAYIKACIEAVNSLTNKDANILVLGNTNSKFFPKELDIYADKRKNFGKGLININFLINYDWGWDLNSGINRGDRKNILSSIASNNISKMDLIIRWGGMSRLSGFLPIQSVYSDFYIINNFWPDFKEDDFIEALEWYQDCDVTLGG